MTRLFAYFCLLLLYKSLPGTEQVLESARRARDGADAAGRLRSGGEVFQSRIDVLQQEVRDRALQRRAVRAEAGRQDSGAAALDERT